jgi:hypothetical protein
LSHCATPWPDIGRKNKDASSLLTTK